MSSKTCKAKQLYWTSTLFSGTDVRELIHRQWGLHKEELGMNSLQGVTIPRFSNPNKLIVIMKKYEIEFFNNMYEELWKGATREKKFLHVAPFCSLNLTEKSSKTFLRNAYFKRHQFYKETSLKMDVFLFYIPFFFFSPQFFPPSLFL